LKPPATEGAASGGAGLPSAFAGASGATTGTSTVTNSGSLSGCTVNGGTGSGTQVADEAGNVHSYCKDALGRVTSVTEPGGTVTNYSYDVFNNLTGVSRGGGTRSFSYNALGWLLSATNPENNTVTYNMYDGNGNLTKFTDGQQVVTAMTYDALNRMMSKGYTVPGNSTTAATSSVAYQYDQDFRGALSQVCVLSCTPGTGTVIDGFMHDGLGRVNVSTEQIGQDSPFSFSYEYSLTDQLTQITYPSGRIVNYTLDAADRIQSVQKPRRRRPATMPA
jgi:YD repeat-containing protein